MQTCYNCGKQVEDNVLICPECGALVKRYGKPVTDAAPEETPYMEPSSAESSRYLQKDAEGKLHFRGAVKVWLILSIVGSLYFALSFGASLLLYQYRDLYMDALETYEELASMKEIMTMVLENIEQLLPIYMALAFLLLVKGVCAIGFLSGKSRRVFWIMAGSAVILTLAELIFGSFLSALLFCVDVIIVYVLLRKDWKQLKK